MELSILLDNRGFNTVKFASEGSLSVCRIKFPPNFPIQEKRGKQR